MGSFTWIDGAVLVAYLLGTSIIAERLAGKRQTIRDFFLGGRRLPWWAVAGSIVAAEVSGVTFVSVPVTAYTGDFTYLMLATGSLLARGLVAWLLVPAYYRHEIYSQYEYMGRRLGPQVDRLATFLFFVGSFLAQGARLFLAAVVLDVLTGMGVVWAIVAIGAVSVVWTWIGGINSVVWTDVVQFVILFAGGVIALVAVGLIVPGGWSAILESGAEAGKLRVVNGSLDPTQAYTLWAGLFGFTFLTLASHGTDQNMAQRLFCCRDVREARKAILWSSVSQVLPLLMLAVGLGIWAYYRTAGVPPIEGDPRFQANKDTLLPLFILQAMPAGLKGLLFAAVFSAATATSTLAAMAQTALTGFYKPLLRPDAPEAHYLRVSRVFVLLAAVGLCATAVLCIQLREQYKAIVDLALAMAGYTYGGLLGMLLFALLPLRRDARGLAWSVPLSMTLIFACHWNHTAGGRAAAGVMASLIAVGALVRRVREPQAVAWVFLGAAAVAAVAWTGLKLAYPWHYPLGTALTFFVGWGAGRRLEAARREGP
ncbi:MAG TPA: sodium/solute symporter [Planctomycetota bacterium]|nr:sodium/solute symporter [Planctomycetota bacterium]